MIERGDWLANPGGRLVGYVRYLEMFHPNIFGMASADQNRAQLRVFKSDRKKHKLSTMHVTRHQSRSSMGISTPFLYFIFQTPSVPRRTGRAGRPIGIAPLRTMVSQSAAQERAGARTGRNHQLVSLRPDPQKPYLVLRREGAAGVQLFSLLHQAQTHPFILFPADLLQPSLNAIDDSLDHPCILPALIPLKHDPRMPDYADRPSPGQDHVAQHRPVSAQHRQRLLDLGWGRRAGV